MVPNGTVLRNTTEDAPAPQGTAYARPDLERGYFCELLKPESACGLIEPWNALAAASLERNPFFEPWALIPALEHFADKQVRLACVWSGPDRSNLLGLVPITAMRGYARLPVGYWGTWRHPHCYYAAPLVHRDFAAAVCASMLGLLCDGDDARSFLRLSLLDEEGPTVAAFRHAAKIKQREYYCAGSYDRAALFSGASPAEFISTHIRKKKQKEFKRLKSRLSEQGVIQFHQLEDKADLERWTELFMAMEHNSWRGRKNTSLASSPSDATWFQSALAGAFEAGQLSFLRLDCGGQSIAMLVCFGASQKYSIKICHDPAFGRFSPGVMIELEATKHLLRDSTFSFMDSCAVRDHKMINSLWPERRRITGLNVSGVRRKSILRLCRALEGMRMHVGSALNSVMRGGA